MFYIEMEKMNIFLMNAIRNRTDEIIAYQRFQMKITVIMSNINESSESYPVQI